ncbi:P-loop containing nucleoside triphosphate hydrolase protein, partial [Chytriomyces sp. MP71]
MEERSGKLSDAKQNSTSIAAFEEFDGRKRKASYLDLKRFRGDLPVSSMKSEIVELVQRHQVVIISGETGSGKSTQIPQFLLEAAIEGKNAGNTNIVCTQPRRISATSIASRVSEEMGDPQAFGKGAFVGYSVRLDSRVGPSTRLTFQTTGVLLRRLEQDPMLNGVSHVIVDEVHERSLDSDFLLLNLRRLLLHRRDLRIVLMSATADSAKFATYFESALEGLYCPVLTVPGRTFPVEAFFLEDAVEACGYEIDTGSEFAVRERY